MWRMLRRERPDIAHTHTAKAGTVGRLAAILAGVPVIVHTYHGHIFRGDYFGPAMTRVFLGIERFLGHFTTKIVTVSESQARELAEEFTIAPREQFEVIPNGYDFSRYPDHASRDSLRYEWGISDGETLVVWAGRMVPVKNVELLAEIIRLAREDASLKFVVVGDGTERTKLEAALAGCDNARIAGWAQDMAAVWSAADIALLTSRNEGTPSSLIEAMAAGKPFVSTQAGGVADLFVGTGRATSTDAREFDNGFAFESAAGAMAAVRVLAANPALRRSMGQIGRDFAVRNYSSERLLEDLRSLYYQLSGIRSVRTDQSLSANCV